MSGHVLVFAGGDPPGDVSGRLAAILSGSGSSSGSGSLAAHSDFPAMVVAADSGAVYALAVVGRVDLLVGDLDSIPFDVLAAVEARGTRVERHPAAKDATDLALALDAAMALDPDRVTLVGGGGGRLDHLLANVLLLGSTDYAGAELDALIGPATVTVVRGRRDLHGAPADLVSLLAVGGRAHGVTTHGLRFPLTDAVLLPGSSWGVSNQLVASVASVTVERGTVLAVQPGERGAL